MCIAVDCEWDEFGHWNPCNATCGGGTEFRERAVKTPAQHGGENCIGETREEKPCNIFGCPGNEHFIYIAHSLN